MLYGLCNAKVLPLLPDGNIIPLFISTVTNHILYSTMLITQ